MSTLKGKRPKKESLRTAVKLARVPQKGASILWVKFTRNSFGAYVSDVQVAIVDRPQKHRSDGTKHDWRVTVLGTYMWNKTFRHHDPRDLESTMLAAEARVKWAVRCLSLALKA
jgi:hypothetical protein